MCFMQPHTVHWGHRERTCDCGSVMATWPFCYLLLLSHCTAGLIYYPQSALAPSCSLSVFNQKKYISGLTLRILEYTCDEHGIETLWLSFYFILRSLMCQEDSDSLFHSFPLTHFSKQHNMFCIDSVQLSNSSLLRHRPNRVACFPRGHELKI